ncbi:FIP-RBD domain-containing protein [Caenorhabditis elegans]|uniref:FIP-RBD domain-containing protein n=1 Tax=Caenorhabditis elegans TaxID=6239 RepID=Q8IG15_CAEEL|nr:FIP-RBD domain-containing protein [Caenorhabditis elegans]CCD71871.1 FIP-RBD domain-containing protein [Caenorhabditis elegans]|eukprot:NP_872037.1 Rab-11 Family Interacting-Protein [Caenorhabditis elegans]
MTDVYESPAREDSPMRLQGSSASSASVASRLYGTRSRRDSLGGSSSESDLIAFGGDQDALNDFSSQMNQLNSFTKRYSELEERNMSLSDERTRLKTENSVLKERMHNLEEQLTDNEDRFKQLLSDEKARGTESMSRLKREKELETESWNLKYQMLEKDLISVKKDAERSNEETKRIRNELEKTENKLEEAQLLVEGMEEERIQLERQFRKFKEEAQQDIDSSSEMVEVLALETEELRRKVDGPRSESISDREDMHEEIEILKAKVAELMKEKEEMTDQLLATSVERGRSLIADTPSLADELAGGDSSQLLDALREQEICNQKLRVYINGILMRVIERHPEILEIGEEGILSKLTVRRRISVLANVVVIIDSRRVIITDTFSKNLRLPSLIVSSMGMNRHMTSSTIGTQFLVTWHATFSLFFSFLHPCDFQNALLQMFLCTISSFLVPFTPSNSIFELRATSQIDPVNG